MVKRNPYVRRYLREIQKSMPCRGKRRKGILVQVEASVLEYAMENPDLDYGEIVARFGTPQQIAESYLDELEKPELARQLRINKSIVGIVSLLALTVVLLWTGVVISAKAEHDSWMNGHFEEEIVDVTRIPGEVEGE